MFPFAGRQSARVRPCDGETVSKPHTHTHSRTERHGAGGSSDVTRRGAPSSGGRRRPAERRRWPPGRRGSVRSRPCWKRSRALEREGLRPDPSGSLQMFMLVCYVQGASKHHAMPADARHRAAAESQSVTPDIPSAAEKHPERQASSDAESKRRKLQLRPDELADLDSSGSNLNHVWKTPSASALTELRI